MGGALPGARPRAGVTAAVKVEPLTPASAPAWVALFEACGCTCYCHYWHFGGTKNEWLARCFHEPQANRDDQLALVHAGEPGARGLLALDEAASPAPLAVGWMKLAPRARLPKLRRQGAYRALDLGDDEGVWSIGCLLVHPAHRRRGVARALVAAADEHVSLWGGRAVEAYPRRAPSEPLHDEEAWMGTARFFAAAGYREVAGEGQYPVMRKVLARP